MLLKQSFSEDKYKEFYTKTKLPEKHLYLCSVRKTGFLKW